MHVNVRRIGARARRYLSAGCRSGRVVSIFRGGINVLLEERGERALLSIQSDHLPLHPWAVAADANPERVGGRVDSTAARIQFESGLTLRLRDAQVVALRIERYEVVDARRARSRRPLLDRACRGWQRASPQVVEALTEWQTSGEAGCLATMIGRGPGSTPMGDDVLIGLLAGLWATGWCAKRCREARRLLGNADLSTETTLGSGQAIAAAVDGAFPEPLVDLVTALGHADPTRADAALVSVARIGVTSGHAMLFGLCAGLGADPSGNDSVGRSC
jgi:hypothetical protein